MKLNPQLRNRFNQSWASLAVLLLSFGAPAYAQTADSFNPGADNSILALAVQTDGKIIMGGYFTNLAGGAANYIGRVNLNASLDTNFVASADGLVTCLAIQPDGKVVVGGTFANLDGQACNGLGRLNADGTLDTTFSPSPDGFVQCLAVQADGTIVVGGGFTMLNGQACAHLGRLNSDGSLDTGFTPNPDDVVDTLAIQPNGAVVVGGAFLHLAGQNCNRLGRVLPNGTLDSSFSASADKEVYVLAVQADGKILVGGTFALLDGKSRRNIGRLNVDGTLDTTFNPGANNSVYSLALQTDGSILVGGLFSNLAGQACNYIGRLASTGTFDATFVPGASGNVGALGIQPDGKVLVGGAFTTLGGQSRVGIGRLNNTGSVTQTLSSGGASVTWLRGGSGPEVWRTSFDVSPDGTNWVNLGAGSRITNGWSVTGIVLPPNNILRARGFVADAFVNGSGWFLDTISAPPAITTPPAGLATNAGSSAVFTVQASGTPVFSYQWRKGAANLSDGGNVSGSQTPALTLTNLTGANAGAYAVVVTSPFGSVTSVVANLVVVDPFIAGQPAGRTNNAGTLASFSVLVDGASPLGYQWRKGSTNLVAGGNVFGARSATLTLSNVLGGDAGAYSVVVSNQYGRATSLVANLAVIDPFIVSQPASLGVDAGQLAAFTVTVAASTPLRYQWYKNGTNVAGATAVTLAITNAQGTDIGSYDVVITNSYGKVTSSVAALAVNLATADSWNPTASNYVYALAQQANSKVLVGGGFASLGGQARLCLGQLNTDGTLDPYFNAGASNNVNALAIQSDGKVLVGGDFITLDGQVRRYLGRLNVDGTLDTAFNPAANGPVLALALQSDGKILVGGQFTTLGGQARNYLARLNADGSVDTTFSPAPNNAVMALAVQTNGMIVVGGVFTGVSLQPRNYVARLNADGTLDPNFNPGANSWVYTLALQADGKILAGGVFTALGGQTRWCIGRLNTDGTLDAGFNPVANNLVYALALQADGKVLLGGSFTVLGGQRCQSLGRVNADGSLDTTFNPGANGTVYSLALQADGAILAGGSFTLLDGQPRQYLGRLLATDAVTDDLSYSGTTLTWLRGGPSPEVWRTTFESYVNGTGWVSLGAGTRVAGGWQLTGVNLAPDAVIRARGYAAGAGYSCWFVESTLPPTSLTPPTILSDANFGFQGGQFGFDVSGGVGQNVIVVTSTNLVNWTTLTNLTLGVGPTYFSDPNAASFPVRFYQVLLP